MDPSEVHLYVFCVGSSVSLETGCVQDRGGFFGHMNNGGGVSTLLSADKIKVKSQRKLKENNRGQRQKWQQ